MVTEEEVELVRHVVQKILIPCLLTIGLVGNTLSIIVLTRKRMRCSTNIYLTGLAVTDLLYLVMCFVMSLKHYNGINSYKMFYSLMGLFHWLIDSFSYISTYIVVSFTIERYIAVCHPIRGQSLCTEARAKKVIAIVSVVVMLSILSTAFEYQLSHKLVPVDIITGEPCAIDTIGSTTAKPMNISDATIIVTTEKSDDLSNPYQQYLVNHLPSNCIMVDYYDYEDSPLMKSPTYSIFLYATIIIYSVIPLILLITFNTFLIIAVRKSKKLREDMTNNVNSRQTKQKLSSMTQENRITITLIAVVILFIICQLPWTVITVAVIVVKVEDKFERFISNIANGLVAVNAAANFFLYCLLSDKYRKTVKELITGHHYRRQGTLSGSILSRQTTLGSSWSKHPVKSGIFNENQKKQPLTKVSPLEEIPRPSFRSSNKNVQNNNRKQSTIPEENNLSSSFLEKVDISPSNNNQKSFYFQANENQPLSSTEENHHRQSLTPIDTHLKPLSFASSNPSFKSPEEKIWKHGLSSFEPFDHRPLVNNNRKESIMSAMLPGENNTNPFEQFLRPSCSSHSLTRSQSLDTKPKVKHSPDCKDFPYHL